MSKLVSNGGGVSSSLSSALSSSSSSSSSTSSTLSSSATNSLANTTTTKCTYCLNSLGSVSIQCSECISFYLCLKCFSMSAEIGEHKKDHNYYLKSNICFPLFDSEKFWTHLEEQMLLKMVEQYGFGNWEDIAKHLPNRTGPECMQHYYSYYVYGNLGTYTLNSNLKQSNTSNNFDFSSINSANLYDQSCDNLSSLTLNKKSKQQQQQQHNHNAENELINNKNNNTNNNNSTKSELQTTVLLPPIEMSAEEQRALGYMPLRDDFEREYKNDAEQLLSNLSVANNQLAYLFSNINSNTNQSSSSLSNNNQTEINDDQIDFDLKLSLIKIYRQCLMERQRFKKIAREYGLINNASALINNHNKTNSLTTSSAASSASSTGLIHSVSSACLLSDLPNAVPTPQIGRPRKNPKTINVNTSDKDIYELNDKFKKYAQFISVSDYESLLENLRKQRQLNERINELQHYRSVGITKLSEIDKYNREKLEKQRIKLEFKQFKKHTKRMLNYTSPNKRLTRLTTLKSPEKIYHSALAYKQSPSKRFKTEPMIETIKTRKFNSKNLSRSNSNDSVNDDKTLVDVLTDEANNNENEDMMTDDLNNSDHIDDVDANLSDDLYQEKSDNEDEQNNQDNQSVENHTNNKKTTSVDDDDNGGDGDNNDDDDDDNSETEENTDEDEEDDSEDNEDIEEDLSSAGAASSGGSAINEVNTNNIARRLRRLTSRSSQNNSFSIKKSFDSTINKSNKNSKLNSSLNSNTNKRDTILNKSLKIKNKLKFKNELKQKLRRNNIIERSLTNGGLVQKKINLNNSSSSSSSTVNKSKNKKENIILKNSKNGRRPSERLCSMPGYNLLSENEKKNSSTFRKHNNNNNLNLNNNNDSIQNNQNTTATTATATTPTTTLNSLNSSVSSTTSSSLLSTSQSSSTGSPTASSQSSLNGSSLTKTMMLRRHNQTTELNEETNTNGLTNQSIHDFKENNHILTTTNSNTNQSQLTNSNTTNNSNKSKILMSLLKVSCPSYFQIPRSTRRRILRFLCDNGWIDVS